MSKFKAALFDLDGTLAATAKATVIAVDEVTKKYGLPGITEGQIRAAMGLGGMEFYRKLFPRVPEKALIPIGREIDGLEQSNIMMIGRDILFPGVYATLTTLAKRGHPLFIASTGSKRHVHITLRAGDIEKYFTGVYCDESAKIGMVKRIIAGRDGDGFAMVGDMFKDAEAARGNGIISLGAGYGYLAEENAALFDAVLERPEDIFDYA
jgi:phosphoglycolate phosphatase